MSGISSLRLILLAFVVLFGVAPGQRSSAQTLLDFKVNSVADKVDATPGDGICSTGSLLADGQTPECTLRAAIDETNALQPANPNRHFVVSVMAGTYSLSTSEKCVYTDYRSHPLSTTTAVLCISSNLTLSGADRATTIVDHALVDRDFFVSYGYTVAINNMTIQNGAEYGGSYDGGGGGVNNQGNLTLSNDLVFKNHADVGGAGVDNGNTLVVEGCTFQANSGPAVSSAEPYASYTITSIDNSYFTQNTAGQGPAVSTYLGTLHISNSTAFANTVNENGIVSASDTVVTITNSTISGNTVGNAGAVSLSGGSSTLNNVTISGNTAGNSVGGLLGDTITMSNTILAGNTGDDCAVSGLTDAGHNLVQTVDTDDCTLTSTTLIGVDAKLGTVSLDGGLIPTQGPVPGSPAIGAGSNATPGSNAVGACAAIDERGFVRGRSGACTIGAVEPLGGFEVNNIAPAVGSPGGTAWVVVHGSGFVPGSMVALHGGGGVSLPILQTTVAPDTFSITALLDLSKAVLGSYDVVVTNPANASTTLAGGYMVQQPTTPDLYSYIYGPAGIRAGRPAYYSVVYGNRSNTDAYLVPLTLSLPRSFSDAVLSPISNPPTATGQVLSDWTYVPLEVSPVSPTSATNIALLLPVVPAGFTGVLRFAIEPPDGTPEGTQFFLNASIGFPYSSSAAGTLDPAILSDYVTGAEDYAQTNLGVKLTSADLNAVSTYTSTQLAQVFSNGGQALLASSAGSPVVFSNARLLLDIATYGASLESGSSSAAHASGEREGGAKVLDVRLHPAETSTPNPPSNPCSGQSLQAGTSCTPSPNPVPPPGPPGPQNLTFGQCRDLPNHRVSSDGSECIPNPGTGCPAIPNPEFADPMCTIVPLVGSVDPNEKDGPLGIGIAHFTVAADPFRYQVEFENTPTASAPAQTVSVTDPLDPTKYDLSTFQLGPISFGPYVLTPPPGLISFGGALDLRPSENVIVAVSANLDKNTGIATWKFTSLDPATMQLVTDPTAGFLPPDTNPPVGIGHVSFSLQPLASVASGAQICNTASIVFDTNAAIATAPFCNTKDTTAPLSSVQPLPTTESSTTFTVSWTGTDAGVGTAFYTIYVSNDGGAFTAWQTQTTATSASFSGSAGHTYGFYSIATDQLGNTEGPKTKAEATTTVSSDVPAASPVFSQAGGVYNSPLMVAITDKTPSATIFYTTNGNVPTTQSTLYNRPLSIKSTETLKAIAVAGGYLQSPVSTATYTITPVSVTAPTFSVAGGSYSTAQTVTLSDATSGAIIHYTVDGATPSVSSAVYAAPIYVSVSETIKAIAIASITSSPVASATYTIATSSGQTITFPSLSAETYGAAPITLAATASSGLPVSFSVKGPAKLSGSTLTITGAGDVSVTATQSGNASFAMATPVTRSFNVAKATLTITATSFSRSVGSANPTLSYEISGFVDGDPNSVVSGSVALATTASSKSPIGNYPITFATEGLMAANYSFRYVAGTLTITSASCPTINYPSGFDATDLTLNGGAKLEGSALELTDGGLFEARSAFYSTALPTTSFTTDFTFQITNPDADGMTFVVQSNNPKVVGESGGGLGYAGIPHSVAIKVDLHNNAGEGTDSTGTYINGAYPSVPSIDMGPAGINLHSDHIFAVHLAYNNAVTTGSITDTLTGVSASMNFPGDITEVVGNNAWFGFTAGTGSRAATQKILTWSYKGGTGCSAQ